LSLILGYTYIISSVGLIIPSIGLSHLMITYLLSFSTDD